MPQAHSHPKDGAIRIGIGGWTYAPWRGVFYPENLPHARELEYASSQLTAIEINGTYYSTQKPATFAKWRDETPAGFVFSLKASRYATNRRELAGAKDSIHRFVHSGIADSFACEEYLELARRHGAATVYTDSEDYPSIADRTAAFVYARLMRASTAYKAGYPPKALDAWADRLRSWARGGHPADLPLTGAPEKKARPGDVFAFFINGAKERAPMAARAMIERL